MNIPAIRKLVKNHEVEELKKAEKAIIEEKEPVIDPGGKDEGENLTNILAAVWIKEQMNEGMEFRKALRAYSKRVRESLS